MTWINCVEKCKEKCLKQKTLNRFFKGDGCKLNKARIILPAVSGVFLGKPVNSSQPKFPHMENGKNVVFSRKKQQRFIVYPNTIEVKKTYFLPHEEEEESLDRSTGGFALFGFFYLNIVQLQGAYRH